MKTSQKRRTTRGLIHLRGIWGLLAPAFVSFHNLSVTTVPAAPGAAEGSGTYEAEGTVLFSWYVGQGVTNYPKSHFRVKVDGCRWLIHEESDDKSFYDYNEVFYNGEYIYYVHSMKNVIDELVRRTGVRGASNVANSVIYRGEVFRNEFAHTIGPVWLSYASACYWLAPRNAIAEPVTVFTSFGPRGPSRGPLSFHGYEPAQQRVAWHLDNEPPQLPDTVTYFNGVYTNCLYTVSAVTNFGTKHFPLHATLDTFRDAAAVQQNQQQLLTRYDIRLTAVGSGEHLSRQPPPLPGFSTIADYRFARQTGMLPLQGGVWPSPEQATNSPMYTNRVRLVSNVNTQYLAHSRLTGLVRVAIACSFAAPLIFAAVLLLRKNRKAKKHIVESNHI